MPFIIEPSTEIAYRHDFALLANARGYLDAVEVGVDMGRFSKAFLDRWEGNWLLLVDPYRPHPEFPVDRSMDAMVAALALMPKHHGRFRFIREPSPDAIQFIRTIIKPPGFVYVDAAHDERSVMTDLKAWWESIATDGLMAGHDFDAEHPGVMAAVTEFARERDLIVRLTHETDSPQSWMIYRTEPAKLFQRLFTESEIDNPHAQRSDS